MTAVWSLQAQSNVCARKLEEAKASEDAGNYAAANTSLREALKAAEISGPQRLLPIALNRLALNYESQGLYINAAPLFERTLQAVESVEGRETHDYAVALGNLAATLTELHQTDRAEALVRESIAIQTRNPAADELARAIAESILGRCLFQKQQWTDSAALFEKALAVFERRRDTNRIDFARALNNLGVIRANQDRYRESAEFLEGALNQMNQIAGESHPYLIEPLNNLATVYAHLHRNGEADECYRRAISIARARQITTTDVYGNILRNYAEFLRSTGKRREGGRMAELANSVLSESRRANGIGITVNSLAFRGADR